MSTDPTELIEELKGMARARYDAAYRTHAIETRAASALSSLQADLEASVRMHEDCRVLANDYKADLATLRAVIERARGWAERPIPGYTAENQMAEIADALSAVPAGDTHDFENYEAPAEETHDD